MLTVEKDESEDLTVEGWNVDTEENNQEIENHFDQNKLNSQFPNTAHSKVFK